MFFLVFQFYVFYLFWHIKPQAHWSSFSSLNMSNSKLSLASRLLHVIFLLPRTLFLPFFASLASLHFKHDIYEAYLTIIWHILLFPQFSLSLSLSVSSPPPFWTSLLFLWFPPSVILSPYLISVASAWPHSTTGSFHVQEWWLPAVQTYILPA